MTAGRDAAKPSSMVPVGAYIPAQRWMAVIPAAVAVGIGVAGVLGDLAIPAYKPTLLLIGSLLGGVAGALFVVACCPCERLVTHRLKSRETAGSMAAVALAFGLLLAHHWVVVAGYAAGDAWARAWVVACRSLVDAVSWVVPEIAAYPDRMRALG
jgi:hypothetical protein